MKINKKALLEMILVIGVFGGVIIANPIKTQQIMEPNKDVPKNLSYSIERKIEVVNGEMHVKTIFRNNSEKETTLGLNDKTVVVPAFGMIIEE